jgi:hypothetical protein
MNGMLNPLLDERIYPKNTLSAPALLADEHHRPRPAARRRRIDHEVLRADRR